jgi:predicted RNA polymerase sigma factor
VPTDPVQIAKRLRAIEPRAAQTLILRYVEGLSREDGARAFGISPEAFDVKLWRAVESYRGREPLLPFELEQQHARELASASPGADIEEIAAQASAVRGALDAAARAYEESPARNREDWIRRAIIVAIVLVTAWYGRDTIAGWINSLKSLFGKA